ncbi:MAG: FAD-dependent oxidoreductase [Candidatus Latescibacteria bacterium]|nr:FAD-dependent oxidoreductase [Candidatus Latescibacterota bacterium]NIO55246.1 FAD-dependent oxidoreductase [Candidatus Latescibacterota bacterium]
MGEEKRIATYICRGCDIDKSLDIEALRNVATNDSGIEICRDHPWLCGPEGIETIKKDVNEGAEAVVIAACSPRAMTAAFTFDKCFTERVNLREHVVWCHEPNNEDTQMLAEDYFRIGIARARKAKRPEPHLEEVNKTILVVGGGITGMTAALEAARAGYQVTLVEKEEHLGGWLTKFTSLFPKRPPYRDPQPTQCQEMVAEVEGHERIHVIKGAAIEKISGQPGQFDVSVKVGSKTVTFRIGAIIQATGWKPYDATKLSHLCYGRSPNVITNVQMEELAGNGTITRPSDGQPAKSVAFIQCAGSRDAEHLPYCSAVCCRTSLKQAIHIRERNPDAQVYILYKDIRSPGQYEDFYRRVQENTDIFLTKGDVIGVEPIDGDRLRVDVENTLIEPHIQVDADLVVLATGMVPVAADGEAIRALKSARELIAQGEEGAKLDAAKETVVKLAHHEGTEILNLDYRQGPDLPALKYDFPDSHFICFPYETRRTGIYAAGCMRAPNDTDACREDAAGAAMKAIQCVELSSQGAAVHPRWEDRSIPDFFMQRCTQCKRCTMECPFGTLNEDAEGTPQPNPFRCRRCGICLGSCPERIVNFADYSIEILSSMIKAVEVPDEDEEKPRLLGLICENDAYPALDTIGIKRLRYSPYIRFIPVRCLGSVNVVWISDALSRGYDGILLIGCKSGDDYQCHFIRGSELMGTRGENIQEKLEQLVLESERIRVEEISISEYGRLQQIIDEFAEQIDEVGPNPFKGL